ncbi:hypothetical protein Z517_07980 [Fonsecaea pedrosoi CBS 271.37]|uniref:Uncharacterized protein n=1 Tax=Fonsecaea pedrosoi CBS 271.37 TaxID=1442368 RepID=A0A0D2EV91_9EURO|nr:uncharacterized protein Z517_07980 [Fonsecaea pedrosoi CBS 271.37]KIW78147.1 hypothetical protein Z517_07980 [Fonsecaea pedrosoi CBS 271.37]
MTLTNSLDGQGGSEGKGVVKGDTFPAAASGSSAAPAPSPSPSPPRSKKLTLPEEITSRVISYIVRDGLCISTDARHDIDVATIRCLMRTSVSVRRETLRQVFRQPLRFWLSGVKSCDCQPLLESIGHKECRCTLLLEKIARMPLMRWRRVVVHFVPVVSAWGLGDGVATLRGDSQQTDDDGGGGGGEKEAKEKEVSARSEFLVGAQRVKHYSRSLATTLYFVFKQWAGLDCDAACCGAIEMTRRRYYGPVSVTADANANGGSGDREADHPPQMPLWTMNMVESLLMPWWRIAAKRAPARQIQLPETIAAAFTTARRDLLVAAGFPHKPAAVAEHLRRNFAEFWSFKLEPVPRLDVGSLWLCVVAVDGSRDWYLDPAPLKTAPTKWTIRGIPVLRIDVVGGSGSEEDVDKGSAGGDCGSWTGRFLASDG